jgi:hypothetical protein
MLKLKIKMSLIVEESGGNILNELPSWSEDYDLSRELFTS